MLLPGLLASLLAALPAFSVVAAGWSDRLEPIPWIAIAGVVVSALVHARVRRAPLAFFLLVAIGVIAVSILYASFLPMTSPVERIEIFARRVFDWLGAAFSGAAGTDNLLFAYTMGLLAWSLGMIAGTATFRYLNAWWAIIPTGAALLLNLSYAPPELLPLVFIHLVASFMLLVTLNSARRVARWRTEAVEYGLHQGAGFAATSAAVALLILLVAWRLPTGQVNRGVASAWENVAGPWQALQTNFDRMFASLNPSPLSGRGLTVAQTMAPRGSFELGNEPVMRVSGREPAYWRAATYDRYTGRVMAGSATTSIRLDRGQAIEGSLANDDGRRFTQYSVTVLAPSTSVIYAPDSPVNISVPTVYDYRADVKDFGILRPVAPVREQQRYSVLASVSSASMAELRQAGTIYPAWTRSYVQLPPGLPAAVQQEAWRIVGDATNAYDAASRIEQHLRGFKYSTHVPVPPANRDWVSFLLFESKEGYCDYYATAMTVMLRAVGIPARVASGYVTGDWEPATQSYLVSENHAHTWTEVYFPGYGWITFEPSANRQAPPRLERPLTPVDPDELRSLFDNEDLERDFLDDEELDIGGTLALPPQTAAQTGPSPLLIAAGILLALLLVGGLALAVLWFYGISGLPAFARPYAQVVRLATWSGAGPRPGQTPYEFTEALARTVPPAGSSLRAVSDAYVAGTYGREQFDASAVARVRAAGSEALRILFRLLAVSRWQGWASSRVRTVAGAEPRH